MEVVIWHEIDEIDEIDVLWRVVQEYDEWVDEIDEMVEFGENDENDEIDGSVIDRDEQAQIQDVVLVYDEMVEIDFVDEIDEILYYIMKQQIIHICAVENDETVENELLNDEMVEAFNWIIVLDEHWTLHWMHEIDEKQSIICMRYDYGQNAFIIVEQYVEHDEMVETDEIFLLIKWRMVVIFTNYEMVEIDEVVLV